MISHELMKTALIRFTHVGVGLLLLGWMATSSWAQSETRNIPEVKPIPPAASTKPMSDSATKGSQDTASPSFEPGRVDSINQRIDLLKQLMADERKSIEEQAKSEALENQAMPQMSPNQEQPGVGTIPSEAVPAATEPGAEFVPTLPVNPDGSDTKKQGTPVTTTPVNSFELGNSLYMTGNYRAAIKSFKGLLETELEAEDKIWLQCMIGCCYRMEGDYTKAEMTFREITNQKHTRTYAVDYARWSLGYIEQRKKSSEEFDLIQTELDRLMKGGENDSNQ